MKELYELKPLNARLPQNVYCSDDLSFGLKLRSKKNALTHKYIQINNDKAYIALIVDCDHNNPMIWDDKGLAEPTYIVRNPDLTNRCHMIWIIDKPVFRDYSQKAINYFAKIQQAYTTACNGDKSYVGIIAKNPQHKFWCTTQVNYFYAYSLNELADYVELPKRITKREAIGEGRNCYLFNAIREWAYKEVLFYKSNGATQSDFFNVLLNKLDKLNCFDSGNLDYNELKHIAKSVCKWTWQHFTVEQFNAIFSKIQSNRNKKRKSVIHKSEIVKGFINEFDTK